MESRPAGPVNARGTLRFRTVARLGLSLLLVSFLIGGCKKASREDPISARDDTSFELWIADHNEVLTPAEIEELKVARQQVRYKVMQSRPGLMSDDFALAVYAEIEGKTVHELLVTGYKLQIERMETELLNYQPQLERFQGHLKNPNISEEQQQTVNAALEKLNRLMREHQEELDRLTKRLTELERAEPQKS